MNILFLTLLDFSSIEENGIYTDLMREFVKNGHMVYIISPIEKRKNQPTRLIDSKSHKILKLEIGNIQKTNVIEKGISTLTIEAKFVKGIKKHFAEVKFDLVLYSTPPITLSKCIQYFKQRDHAKTYLLLKDIFPQNAVDLCMMRKGGLLHKFFRAKEKKLYALSDRIGCMSPANVVYVLKHNPEVDPSKVEVCPNSIEFQNINVSSEERNYIRKQYGLPLDKKVFVYGGNLGKPQGVSFIIECLKRLNDEPNCFFFIVGSGTEYGSIEQYIIKDKPNSVKLMKSIPKSDFDHMLAVCDVGLIFLDHRFTIPNFPSRLLSYMQAGIPVLAATDTATDVGKVIVENGFGWWSESNDVNAFCVAVKECIKADLETIADREQQYLIDNYTVQYSFDQIKNSVNPIE